MSYPLLITCDWQATPSEVQTGRMEFVADLGIAYRDATCDLCGKPIAGHIWFRLESESSVSACSEEDR